MINSKKWTITVRALVWTTFGIYCFFLLKLLFLEGRVVRHDLNVIAYLKHSNWIPMRTIVGYFQKLSEDRINTDTVVRNILGNLVVFLPMGCYLPCLGCFFRSKGRCLTVLLGMIVSVEILQILLRIGFFDVDDILFNFLGGLVGVMLVSMAPLQRWLKRLSVIPQTGEK